MPTTAVDFETYYDDECSIRTLGPRAYFSHPDFDAYLVSVVGDNGLEWVGHPREFDWSTLEGHLVLSHNASFDETLFLYGVEQGWWPSFAPESWECTADLMAYLRAPRSLAGAAQAKLGIKADKSTRDKMKGKQADEMAEEFTAEVDEYALEDSRLCLKLWQEYGHLWPEWERAVSRHTRAMMRRGIPINREELDKSIDATEKLLFDFYNLIPWSGGAALLSRAEFNKECQKQGLNPPKSLDAKSPAAQAFYTTAEAFPWVAAFRDWRRVNTLNKKLKTMRGGIVDDGRYYGGMLYAGAHTLRWSGGGGSLNLQNLPKGELFGVNFRALFQAQKDHSFVVVDLSQIEIRTTLYLAGDTDSLNLIRQTGDPYEAIASMFGLHTITDTPLKESNPKLRNDCKIVGLGIQYGASAGKVAAIAGIPEKEASRWTTLFRRKFAKTAALWKTLDRRLRAAARNKEDLVFKLPSGNRMVYNNVRRTSDGITCKQIRNGKPIITRIWYGSIIENLSQALARDIFAYHLLEVEKAWPGATLFHVHDEMVLEVPTKDAETCLREVSNIMSTAPPWVDLPLGAEGTVTQEYCKA